MKVMQESKGFILKPATITETIQLEDGDKVIFNGCALHGEYVCTIHNKGDFALIKLPGCLTLMQLSLSDGKAINAPFIGVSVNVGATFAYHNANLRAAATSAKDFKVVPAKSYRPVHQGYSGGMP